MLARQAALALWLWLWYPLCIEKFGVII